jgi:cysteine desulfurase/selenocysteine lyase
MSIIEDHKAPALPSEVEAKAVDAQEVEAREVPSLDVERVRKDFAILDRTVNGHPLVYLDSAASAQKPRQVLDAERDCYERYYANVHRGVHSLSMEATEAYEDARGKIARMLGCACNREIVFVRSTTEAINLVAATFARERVEAGDEVLVTGLEHHSNIVPWQMLCQEKGARLVPVPINDRGEVTLEAFESCLSERTKMAAFAHISNALGTVLPVRELCALASERGVPTLVDGAQAAPHIPVDVHEIGCDFYAVSGHKMYGPSGTGALWARLEHLESMPPYQGGGEMIASVTFEKTTYNVPPHKFEAGTPNIAGAIGLGAAADYIQGLGFDAIVAHEKALLDTATEAVGGIPGVNLIGTAREKEAVLSFTIDGVHPHDGGTILDREGVAVRAGHHCAQPVMDHFGVPATLRASFGVYNTLEEIDRLVVAIHRVQEVFA